MEDQQKTWVSAHRSALFLCALILVSLFLFAVSAILEDRAPSKILESLAGSILAAAIVTIFLSFSDVRDQLSHTIARLLSEGHVVRELSSEARDNLRREAFLTDIARSTKILEQTVYKQLSDLLQGCLSTPHAHNFNVTETISKMPGNRFTEIASETTVSYILRASHLHGKTTVPFEMVFSNYIPTGSESEYTDNLTDFEAEIGSQKFGKEAVIVEHAKGDGEDDFRVYFKTSIEIDEETHVKIRFRIVGPQADNVSIQMARYPTQHFNFTFTYEGDFDFDATWFKSGSPTITETKQRSVTKIANGITATANDWVLPGEGVVVSWLDRPTSRILDLTQRKIL